MKFCEAQTFWFERCLDVVLEVLQVNDSKFKKKPDEVGLKYAPIYIDPFSHYLFMKFCVAQTFLSNILCKRRYIPYEDSLKKLGWLLYK